MKDPKQAKLDQDLRKRKSNNAYAPGDKLEDEEKAVPGDLMDLPPNLGSLEEQVNRRRDSSNLAITIIVFTMLLGFSVAILGVSLFSLMLDSTRFYYLKIFGALGSALLAAVSFTSLVSIANEHFKSARGRHYRYQLPKNRSVVVEPKPKEAHLEA